MSKKSQTFSDIDSAQTDNINNQEKQSDNFVFAENAPIRTYEEALEEILDEEAMDILPDWDNRYLGTLLGHLMKNGADDKSIEKFAEKYKIGSKEEIAERINQLREINKQAHRIRFNLTPQTLKKYAEQQPTSSSHASLTPAASSSSDRIIQEHPSGSWTNAIWEIAKDRRVPETSQNTLPEAFQNCAKYAKLEEKTICNDVFVKSNKFVADINYKLIYEYLALLLDSRSIPNFHSLESAILLEIFDELEQMVRIQFPELREALTEIFENLHHLSEKDFKPVELLNANNIGEKCINVLGLPTELLDLNEITTDKLKQK